MKRTDLVETEIYYGKSLLGLISGTPVRDISYVKVKETGDSGGEDNIIEGVSSMRKTIRVLMKKENY